MKINDKIKRETKSVKALPLDTLAKGDHMLKFESENEVGKLVNLTEKGDLNLVKRARKKYFSSALIFALIDAGKQNENSKLVRSYWNSYHCCNVLSESEDGKIAGKYCKNRWCMVCNSVKTAKEVHKYKPIIDNWKDSVFVTLTEKNCKSENLESRIEYFHSWFTNTKRRFNRKFDENLTCLRKFECTHSWRTGYNPHFHIIFKNHSMGSFVLEEWLKTNELTDRKGQDIKKTSKGELLELFKYMTKVVVKSETKSNRVINGAALDIIFNAMRGKHIIRPFGFRLKKEEGETNEKIDGLIVALWHWHQSEADWINETNNNCLTNYKPSDKFRDFVEKYSNKTSIPELKNESNSMKCNTNYSV